MSDATHPPEGAPDADPVADRVLADATGFTPVPGAAPTPPTGESQIRRVGSQTMVYAMGVLAGRALSFLLLPLYTRYLSPADYGVIQLVELVFDVLTLIAGARLATGLYHFYFKANGPDERHELLSTATIAVATGYIVVGAMAFAFAPYLSHVVFSSDAYTTVIRIAAISFPLQGLIIVPSLMLRAQERPLYYVALTTGKLFGQAALNVLFLVVFDLGVLSMFLSTLITSAILAAWLLYEQVRQTGMRFSTPVFRTLARYGLPLILTQVATIFTTFGDRFFLQRAADQSVAGVSTAGETAVGLYALAYQFGFLLLSVGVEPFNSVWSPIRFDIAKGPDRHEVFSRVFILSNVFVITLAMGIALFVRDVIALLATPAYHSAADIVPIVLLAYVFQAWTGTQDTGIMITERTHWNTIANWAAALIALVGYVLLIPPYLGAGAAWTTVAALAARHVIIYNASQRLWPIHWQWGPVLRLLGLAVTLVVVHELIPAPSRIISILIGVALFITYLAGVWTLNILPAEARAQARGFVRAPRAAFLAAINGPRSPSRKT